MSSKQHRFIAASLLALCGALAGCSRQEVPQLSAEQVQAIVKDYLQAHPEVIQQALSAQAQRETEATQARQRAALDQHYQELVANPASPVAGNPKGDATIVEFLDYRCGHCRRSDPEMRQLIRDDAKIRLVYKQLPILGPDSALAARAAVAADLQGKHAALHPALIGAAAIDEATIDRLAQRAGLDMARFRADMASDEVTRRIQQDTVLAQALGINGTPSYVVGRQLLSGAGGIDSIRALVTLHREVAMAGAAAASSSQP